MDNLLTEEINNKGWFLIMKNLYNWCKSNKRFDMINEFCEDLNHINIKDVPKNSNKKYWWKCKKNHTWKATIKERIKDNIGCPICTTGHKATFFEFIIGHLIGKYYQVTLNFKPSWLENRELDIYVKNCNNTWKNQSYDAICIEYDGARFHQDIKRDIEKRKMCQEKNIHLIRIREVGCPKLKWEDCIVLKENSEREVFNTALRILKRLDKVPTVSFEKEIKIIRKKYKKYIEN